ncbi:hypothetical protein FQA39_LY01633 [Lamprigera yunnana]|nr:hypothetical protein FQA39_LY01633 [Lamprigera yunnana]
MSNSDENSEEPYSASADEWLLYDSDETPVESTLSSSASPSASSSQGLEKINAIEDKEASTPEERKQKRHSNLGKILECRCKCAENCTKEECEKIFVKCKSVANHNEENFYLRWCVRSVSIPRCCKKNNDSVFIGCLREYFTNISWFRCLKKTVQISIMWIILRGSARTVNRIKLDFSDPVNLSGYEPKITPGYNFFRGCRCQKSPVLDDPVRHLALSKITY